MCFFNHTDETVIIRNVPPRRAVGWTKSVHSCEAQNTEWHRPNASQMPSSSTDAFISFRTTSVYVSHFRSGLASFLFVWGFIFLLLFALSFLMAF